MKRKAITIMMMLFLASTVMALFPLSVKAKATKTYLTGTETSGPILDPGIMWISEEGIIHIRGFVHVWYDVCTDPRCTGMNTVVANVNLDPTTGTGRMWGTYSTEVDGVVTWEGTWTGTMHADDSESIRAVGHGRGPLEGLKVQITIEFPPDPTAPGIISGYILDPTANKWSVLHVGSNLFPLFFVKSAASNTKSDAHKKDILLNKQSKNQLDACMH